MMRFFILLALAASSAYAQTEPLQVAVRACTGTPTSDLMSGCPTAQTVWADPKPETLVVTMRSGAVTTNWARFDSLAATDRVSACLKSDTPTGAFASCPTRVSGTTNWLARSLVAVGTVIHAPKTECLISWTMVTEYEPPHGAAIITEYQLWKGPTPDLLLRHATVRSDILSYTFAGLTPGTWLVAVSAIDNQSAPIESARSNILECVIADIPKILKAPVATLGVP